VSLAILPLAAGSACAATSCPADAVGTGVHLDATAWAHGEALTATICLDGACQSALPAERATPDDLFLYTGLPSGQATVEVRLTANGGRSLDVSATAPVRQVKLQGDGCGSTPEIDLAVDSGGALVPGNKRNLGSPETPRPKRSVPRPSGLPKP
jgi:hypothetical protein